MLDNIVAMQQQLQNVDDATIRRALSTPNEAVPQFLLMMEMKRRQDLRSTPQGPVKPRDMRTEMAMGTYQPVPKPPPKVPDFTDSGIMSGMGMGGQDAQQGGVQAPQGPTPQNLDVTKPAGLGSLFGGNR